MRSKIARLPAELRDELDAKIVANGFADYRGLAAWLTARGCSISRHAVNRHSQKLERKLAAVKLATKLARAIARAGDANAMNDALIRLVQQVDFEILVQLEAAGVEQVDAKTLTAITRSVTTLARASEQQQRWIAETRAKLEAKVAAAGAQVADVARQNGLSDDAARQIRNALLEIKV